MRATVLAAAVAGLALTALVAVVPALDFAYRNDDLHIALRTTEALIGLCAAFLALGRVMRLRRLNDLLLCCGLACLALASLAFTEAPAIFWHDTSAFASWSATLGRLAGAGLLAAAAVCGPIPLGRRRRLPLAVVGVSALTLVAIGIAVALLRHQLPHSLPIAKGHGFGIHGEPSIAVLLAITCVLFVIAAVGFTRESIREGDRLAGGLAIACVFAATARLNFLNFPSTFTDRISLGDVFALLFYLVILVNAMREIQNYWRTTAATAALEERRRIARDLHDGLAQELASVQRNLRWLDEENPFVQRANHSAARALHDARLAIAALDNGESEQPLPELLETAARSVADREGTELVLKLAQAADVDPAARHALALITCEAITNAARHGNAPLVHVELVDRPRVRVTISDFGIGFDPGNGHAGFGLRGMSERAESIGAKLKLTSSPGRGTRVVVTM